MLRKLLKYDLRAALRIFIPAWLGIVGLTGLQCLLYSFGTDSPLVILIGLSTIPYVLGSVAMLILPGIFFALRFYRGLLGREGYLMFSLPAQPWKLLTSKLLTAVIVTSVNFIVVVGCLFGWIASMVGSYELDVSLQYIFGEVDGSGALLLIPVVMLLGCVSSNLMIYLACCLGHLFRSRRGAWSFLMYMAMSTVMSAVSSIVQRIQIYTNSGIYESAHTLLTNTLGATIPLALGASVLCFFFCERILHNKLNLE